MSKWHFNRLHCWSLIKRVTLPLGSTEGKESLGQSKKKERKKERLVAEEIIPSTMLKGDDALEK